MIFLTIIMLIMSIVSILKGGLFSGFIKEFGELYEDGEDGKPVPKKGIEDGRYIAYGIKSLIVVLGGITSLVLQFVFISSALAIDILIFPTIIFLTYFIGNLILALAGKKKKKTVKEATKDSAWSKVKRILFLFYVIYIFILILI